MIDVPGCRAPADARAFARVYTELHGIAQRLMSRERSSHTLRPTELVHEAWLKLSDSGSERGDDARRHYLRTAARAMRQVLVDHARAKRTLKRDPGASVRGERILTVFERRAIDVLDIDAALHELGALDPELAALVELRFFAGLSVAETARALECSESAVDRGWRTARAFLLRRLKASERG